MMQFAFNDYWNNKSQLCARLDHIHDLTVIDLNYSVCFKNKQFKLGRSVILHTSIIST